LPSLAPDIDALPRLAAGPGDGAAALINRAFAIEDEGAKNMAADCRASGGRNKSDYSRSVAVTMRGPAYLGVVSSESWYCGGAYPDESVTPLVYDPATGIRVDWRKLLPAPIIDNTADYNERGEGLIVSAALTALYLPAATDKTECREVLATWDGGPGFMLWPDAGADGIAIQPNNLPHVVKACGPEVVLAMPQLRKLGVAPALLDAIDEGHRRGWYDKRAQKP
jgi:hypothetical protein